eukprot:SM000063S19979  [mRNA]  locus=s63:25366:26101:- [translate_table: standard]
MQLVSSARSNSGGFVEVEAVWQEEWDWMAAYFDRPMARESLWVHRRFLLESGVLGEGWENAEAEWACKRAAEVEDEEWGAADEARGGVEQQSVCHLLDAVVARSGATV